MKKKYEEIIEELSDREIVFHLIATQLLLLIISVILGFILFDSFSAFKELFKWEDTRIWTIGAMAGLFVVLLDLSFMKLLPASLYDDGGLNVKLFRNKTVWQIALIAFFVAVSEEILFRGIIQTHAGLIVTSIIFALIHYRYLFNLFLFVNIIALSFFVGYIYELTENLLATILMHFLIDFLLGLYIRFSKKDRKLEGGPHE